MSRSEPSVELRNPCERWLEWHGSRGVVQYYDKETKQKVDLGDDLTLCVLDFETSTVSGWHEKSESRIFANSVRSTTKEEFVVKSFKGGELARGRWADIKETVAAKSFGGHFVTNIYAAMEVDDGRVALVCLQLSGAALYAWNEFKKGKRAAIESRAVQVDGSDGHKNGSVSYKTPKFKIADPDSGFAAAALALCRDVLQPYLRAYFSRAAEPVEVSDEPGLDAEFGGDLGPETVVEIPGGDDFAPDGKPRF